MDEQMEQNRIQRESMRMCEYLARVWSASLPQTELKDASNLTQEEEVYINRSAFQLGQIFTVHCFIITVANGYLRLLREPDRAREISREGLQNLHDFMEELTDLLSKEYNWCK